MKEQFFNAKSSCINYVEITSDKPPLLLLHGASSRWQSFETIIPELAKNYSVYAIDLRGHGKSMRADSYQIEDYSNDVALFLKEHVKKPAFVFGNSFGGAIAAILAYKYPALVEKIIIGDAPLTKMTFHNLVESQYELANCCINKLREQKVTEIFANINNDFVATSISLCDPNMLDAMFNHFADNFADYDVIKLINLIQCPVLILHGDPNKGSLISAEDLIQLSKLSSKPEIISMPNVGHNILDNSKRVIEIINILKTK